MTGSRCREILPREHGGKGPLPPARGAGLALPLRRLSRPPDHLDGRPTLTSKRPANGRPRCPQHSACGALVKVTAIDLLADIEHLRAFTDVLACDLDSSALVVLTAIVSLLERKQRQQADDMSDVLRLGRVRQLATSELDRLLGRQ
jgi:hypothetical protein